MRRDAIKRQLIKLANAMMAGGKKRVKCEGSLFDLMITVEDQKKDGNWVTSYRLGGSCALGAAYEGVFGTPPIVEGQYGMQVNGGESHMQNRLEKKLPVLTVSLDEITDGNTDDYESLANAIIARNDGEQQPRWKIARWLRRLAAKL